MAKEIFLIEHEGQCVVFAPLKGLIMEVASKAEKEKIAALMNQSHFSFDDLIVTFPEIEENRLLSEQDRSNETIKQENGFHPSSIVLFPTFGCHLRCIYCYAKGGEQKVSIDRELAETVVEFVVANAKFKDHGRCSLEFHGGGEPTWNWSIFQFVLNYFREKTRLHRLESETSLVTNGMLSPHQVNWIAEHIQEVQVSLDGMTKIQNSQRPTASKAGSFPTVSRTISLLLAKGVRVRIHSVITERSVNRMPEIIHFFAENFRGSSIQLEPVFPRGRALSTNQAFPTADLFVRGFIEALEMGKSLGVEILYSGARPQLTVLNDNFCGVNEPNFIVTPTGLVTACTEVAEMGHQFAEYFIYGHYDRVRRQFQFDDEKIKWLRDWSAAEHPECKECFARFYCGGECMVYNLDSDGTQKPSLLNPRCTINRELTKHFIFQQFPIKI